MKIRFTGKGLITGSIYGIAAWIALGSRMGVVPIIGTLIIFIIMAFAVSEDDPAPSVSLNAAILGAIFAAGVVYGMKNFGLAVFFFSVMTTAFSYFSPRR